MENVNFPYKLIYLIGRGKEDAEATVDLDKAKEAQRQGHIVKVFDGEVVSDSKA